jgi:non-ribosomal peptide synthetase-like protein
MFLDNFFENSVILYPNNIAIEQGETKYSYAQAEQKANKLANFLKTQSLGPEDKVVILLPRIADVPIVMLGVLKTGAAYIPLDPEIPANRVNFIMKDAEAKLLITSDEILSRIGSQLKPFPIYNIDKSFSELNSYPDTKPNVPDRTSDNLCYMIYTSGTTGKPKGVLLEHKNAVTYVNSAQDIYPIDHTDRALQGFSVSFDASVEEIWVPLSVGATLVIGTFDIMRSGDQFSGILNRLNITFLSCAPTLLSMVKEDIPRLKMLIFGGEVCSKDIAARWCKSGRIVYNTYGPTEATVIATYSVLKPYGEVTIGKALKDYEVLLVDEKLEPITEKGKEGEILIGGESIARGYLHREDLTARKFIETDKYCGSMKRYYRTGDLAKYNDDKEFVFIGRADAQVKVRGFRVELAEIEGLLMKSEGVQASAVKLDEKTQQLAAYVVLRKNSKIDREAIAQLFRQLLPYYMIPSTLDVISELPMTSSQKIDRKRLPDPKTPLAFSAKKKIIHPTTPLEKEMVRIIAKNIQREDISMDDNFFNDLGGHSLLAAIVVSEMRELKMFEKMSVADVYKFPILSDLAREMEKKKPKENAKPEKERDIYKPSNLSYYTCSFFQGIALLFLILLFGLEWLGPFFIYSYYYQADNGILNSLIISFGAYFCILPVLSILSIGFKWIVLGRIKPGKYKLWGSYYFRFWLVDKVISVCPVIYFTGTSIMNTFLRLMGAKVGKNVYINASAINVFDLLKIGDNVSICTDTHLRGYTIEDGYLKIGSIELGDNAFVGTRCCLAINSKMEKNSSIEDLTLVSEGCTIPENENWGGSPAAKISTNKSQSAIPLWNKKYTILALFCVFLIPLITMIAFSPGMMLVAHINYVSEIWGFLWITLFVGISFVLFLTLIIALLKWLLLGNIKEGVYPVNSFFYYKKWFFDQLMKLSLQVIGTLYTTLYLQIWFKLLGVKMGKRVEISTVEFISPDLLVTGDECFLADSVSVGASYVRNGYIEIAKTYIGNRTFVGNSAVLSPKSKLGDDVLVGVLSKMKQEDLPVKDGTSWFGSPAVFLPKRDINHDFTAARTYKPSRKLFFYRYAIEFFRVVLPSTFFIAFAGIITDAVSYLQVEKDLGVLLLVFPLLYIGASILGTLVIAILKWIIIGKYTPAKKPLWSGYVWRSELITGLYENFLVLFFLNVLTGTGFIKYPLRLLGCKIGKRACLYTTQITEFDLIHIDDDVALNDNCTMQTHLFEDRVMKMSYIHLENNSSVGGMSVVLYDSKMEKNSILEPLSVLMKSETLPANNRFIGAPAEKI